MSTEQLARCLRHHTESIRPPKDTATLEAARRASRGLWLDSPATRRADALIEVVQRGVSSPGAAPSTDRAKVVVTSTSTS